MEVREYRQSDLLKVLALSGDEWEATLKTLASSLLRHYDGQVTKAFVAVSDEEVIGIVYGFALPTDTLLAEFMYVKPEYRRQGIGRMLLREIEEQSNCDVSLIFYNTSLRPIYAAQGYETGENIEVAMKLLI